MWKHIFLCILIVGISGQNQELKLPVKPQTQERLSEALQKLSDELQNFRTFFENRVNLFRRITIVQEYLEQVHDQVSQYDNVLIGQQNNIEGCKNIILGSFNTITGSNNYVFIQKYNGRANGDLLLGRWRIDIQNKNLVLINPSSAISFINEQFNRKYLRYLTKNNGGFGYGTNLGQNVVILVKESQGDNNFDANKRVSYGSTSSPYKVNNQFQYGFIPPSSFQTNTNDFTKQIIQPFSSEHNQQQIVNQPQESQKVHLQNVNPVFILNIPLPTSSTQIQPDMLASKSTQLLNSLAKDILQPTQATRYFPQHGAVITSGPMILPKTQINTLAYQASKNSQTLVDDKDKSYGNHLQNLNQLAINFQKNLRSEIFSTDNDPPLTNSQNYFNFGSFSITDSSQNKTTNFQNFILSTKEQSPQINLSTIKIIN